MSQDEPKPISRFRNAIQSQIAQGRSLFALARNARPKYSSGLCTSHEIQDKLDKSIDINEEWRLETVYIYTTVYCLISSIKVISDKSENKILSEIIELLTEDEVSRVLVIRQI